jgi:hypothetical protein
MEGFKSNPKMQCFKEGGQVKYETRKEHKEEMKADVAQDKAIVKKAFKIHDTQSHEGEKTNLSKLRKGGRAKKDCGTVKKYKTGGSVSNVYEAKKDSGDKDAIKKVKQIKPTMAAAKSAPVGKPKNTAAKYCGGGKAYADGGIVEAIKSGATKLKENILGTEEQNKTAQENLDKQAAKGSKLASFLGGKAQAPSAPENQGTGSNINKKRGGKVC